MPNNNANITHLPTDETLAAGLTRIANALGGGGGGGGGTKTVTPTTFDPDLENEQITLELSAADAADILDNDYDFLVFNVENYIGMNPVMVKQSTASGVRAFMALLDADGALFFMSYSIITSSQTTTQNSSIINLTA